MDIVLKNVKKKDLKLIKLLSKRLDIEIEINLSEEKHSRPQYVKEILEAAEEVRNGGGTRIEMKDLNKYLGLDAKDLD